MTISKSDRKIILMLLFVCSIRGETVSPEVKGDESIAAQTGSDNYVAAIHAVDRLVAKHEYGALCRVLVKLSNNKNVESHQVASSKGVVLEALLGAPEGLEDVNDCLLAFLEKNNRQILNANSDGSGQYMVNRRIVNRLSRLLRVPENDVVFHDSVSISRFIERIKTTPDGLSSTITDSREKSYAAAPQSSSRPAKSQTAKLDGACLDAPSSPRNQTFKSVLGCVVAGIGVVVLLCFVIHGVIRRRRGDSGSTS